MAVRVRYGTRAEPGRESESGGGYSETRTLLWSNPTPTTSRGSFTATLSESIDNFDFYEVEYCLSTTNQTKATTIRTPVKYADGNYIFVDVGNNLRGALTAYTSSLAVYERRYSITNATTITFTTASRVAASGESTTYSIPLAIYGIKTNGQSSQTSVTFSDPMIVTPFRNNTTGTLTFPSDGKYLICLFVAANVATSATLNVITGSLSGLITLPQVTTSANFHDDGQKIRAHVYVADVTAGTRINTTAASGISLGYAVKINQ